ncbi:MAG: SCP2 sterol-binding domain-containing protein [Promethearchaeia archaeon]
MSINIQPPEDMIGISLYNILSSRDDEEFIQLVNGWNKTVVIEITGFYPVAVHFHNLNISFSLDIPDNYDLKVTMSIHTLLDLAYKRTNPVVAVLTGKLKIKGLYKIGTVLKFQKIFFNTMKQVAAEPNTNYYEVYKETK